MVQPARWVRVESVDTREGISGKEHKILLPLVLSPTRSLFLCLHRKMRRGERENYKPEDYECTYGWRSRSVPKDEEGCSIVVVGGRSSAMGREWLRNQVVSQWA